MTAQPQFAFDPAFLTGSHYFETAHADSDTDWFVKDSPAARALLESCGFRKAHEFSGVDVRAVYGSPDGKIHVLLVLDPKRKALIQIAMKLAELGPWLRYKTLARKLWRFGVLLTDCRLMRGLYS